MHRVREARRRARPAARERARSCARCSAGAELLAAEWERRGGRVERHLVHRAAPRRAWRPSAGSGCTHGRGAPPVRGECLAGDGPVVAATDYMRAVPDQIRPWVAAPLHGARHRRLRPQRLPRGLRRFFEVDRDHVVVAALRALGPRPTDAAAGHRRTTRSTRMRRRHGFVDRGEGPRHRGLRRRPVVEMLVALATSSTVEDALVTLESDKATMEVPSPVCGCGRGTARRRVGDNVAEGTTLLLIEPAQGEPDGRPGAERRGQVAETEPGRGAERSAPAAAPQARPPLHRRPPAAPDADERRVYAAPVGAPAGPRAGRRSREGHGSGRAGASQGRLRPRRERARVPAPGTAGRRRGRGRPRSGERVAADADPAARARTTCSKRGRRSRTSPITRTPTSPSSRRSASSSTPSSPTSR